MKHPVLFGEYELTVDDKSRLLIPSEIRRVIDPAIHGDAVFLVIGVNRKPWIYWDRYYEDLIARVPQEMIPGMDLLAFDQLNFALASRLEPDKQGRMLVPEKTLRRAGIGREITMIGVRDHLEIWNRTDWDAHREELERRSADIALAAIKQLRPPPAPERAL